MFCSPHSTVPLWNNPVGDVNPHLGLQCVRLMREKMGDREVSKCNGLKELHVAANRRSDFQEEAIDSGSHVKVWLSQIFVRLQLKGKKFTVFNAASPPVNQGNVGRIVIS